MPKRKKKLYEKMGDCACALKNFTKAIEYYKLMLKYAEKCGIGGKELGSCYYSLAETYKDNNQFSEAEEYFEREYSLCENLKDNLNTLSRIADTKEAAGAPVEDVKKVYERAFNNCRSSGNLKEERRMLTRMISYLRRVGSHSDAFESEKYLNSLEEPDDDESSSSGNESDQSDLKSEIGYDLDLDDITDNSEDSDFEQKSAAETSTSVGKRKHRNFAVKKNAKGESQLHVACINGKIPVVRHLLEQGHPVNVRDNSGWLPLHEACNHGFTEIVGMLLDKGAAINDRGGTQCEGITPIYDAANNGHVGVVKLLLDRGASAIVKTDNGDTPLNVLKTWHRKNPFAGEDLELYNGVVKRMSEAMEKVGEKVDEVDFSFVDSPEPMDIRAGEDRSDHGEMEVEAFDADEPHFSRLFENDVSNPRFDVSSFSRMPKNVRQPKQKFGNTSGKKPALIRQDHTLDDWLEDDIQASRLAKKRRTTLTDSSISSSYWSQEHRNSKSPRTSPLKRTSNEFVSLDGFVDDDNSVEEVLQPSRNERLSLSGSRQSTTKKTLRRFNSGSSTSSSRITQYLRRTPSFEDNSGARHSTGNFVEPDSTTSQSSSQGSQTARSFEAAHISAAPPAGDVMLYVDVKIETKVFRVPVWMSQIQTKTIGWLAEEAAQKYARKECSKPSLELETTTGALLSDDDPLTLLFPFGATKAEPVVGRIIEMSLPSLIDRYKEACTHAKTATNATVVEAIEEMSIRLSLENKALTGATLAPLCIALNHQSSLLELNLSANFLDLSCFTKLCSSLPTLVNLTILNLRCSGLSSSHLGEMVKVVSTASARVLEKLSDLDLSDNYLRDKSFRYLSELTNKLKLSRLNVSNVGLTKIDSSPLELRGLRSLDVSDNRLDAAGVAKVVSWTNPALMSDLNVSRNERSNESVLASVIDHMKGSESIALEALNVSRCNLQENELYGLLRLCSGKSLKKLNLSYNQNLTGISLRRLLEFSALREINLIGCENIFQYFDGCEGCDLLQGNGDDTEKVLKLSANMSVHSSQIDVLTEAFKKMNSDLSIETGDVVIFKSSRKGGEALRNFL
nr:tonsoku-like protein [Leptinotarsa decemlineata]